MRPDGFEKGLDGQVNTSVVKSGLPEEISANVNRGTKILTSSVLTILLNR